MNIGSCTSCQPASASVNTARQNQQLRLEEDVVAKAQRDKNQQVQPAFIPDPARLLDIQA